MTTISPIDDHNNDTSLLLDNYSRDGVIGPIDVISAEEAITFNNNFFTNHDIFPTSNSSSNAHNGEQQQSQQKQYSQNNNNLFKTHLFVSWVNYIVRHPKLIRIVQIILQTIHIRCWSCDFNIRYYKTKTIIAPHQDATYANLIPSEEVLTVWVALSDPVTVQHGGLLFYIGTHRLGQLPHICDKDDDTDNDNEKVNTNQTGDEKVENTKEKLRNALSRGQRCTIPNNNRTNNNNNEKNGTSIPLRAGQATIHHFYTVHSSGQNAYSNQPRIGLAIRYMTANVRKRQHQHNNNNTVKEMITWISGNTNIIHDDCFEWEPILPECPSTDDIQRGKVAHAIAMEREKINYFS
jgi:ectoine hydroxylase-related dioxygenase (phytanoyl-CoA dioxygenase family)